MNKVIIAELLYKWGYFIIIRGALLFWARSSKWWMKIYRSQLVFWFILTFCWNIIYIWIFADSQEWDYKARYIYIASVILLVDCLLSISQKLCYICWICWLIVGTFITQQQIRVRKRAQIKEAQEINNLLKELKADPQNFQSDEDVCCICLEVLKIDQSPIELPCSKNHIFHFEWITEWLTRDIKCPVWKSVPTLSNIKQRLKEIKKRR